MELFEKLPSAIQAALIGLIVSNIAVLSAAIKAWITSKFYQGAFANVVEAIHTSDCTDCAKLAKAANVADGIEAKVAPIVDEIKADLEKKENA